jgi:hypothetical protein
MIASLARLIQKIFVSHKIHFDLHRHFQNDVDHHVTEVLLEP